jgi:hypothetical protein
MIPNPYKQEPQGKEIGDPKTSRTDSPTGDPVGEENRERMTKRKTGIPNLASFTGSRT